MNIRLFDLRDDLRNLILILKYCNLKKKKEDIYQFRNKTYGGGRGM